MYICMECGNHDNFIFSSEITDKYYYQGEDEYNVDTSEYIDKESYDATDLELEYCDNCQSTNIECIDNSELPRMIWEHIDKEGEWHEEELDEESRDPKLYAEVVLEKL